eukprot:scaffold180127_cov18-Tisochrysis_lutea.AAC.1
MSPGSVFAYHLRGHDGSAASHMPTCLAFTNERSTGNDGCNFTLYVLLYNCRVLIIIIYGPAYDKFPMTPSGSEWQNKNSRA